MPYIYSTLSGDQAYTTYADAGEGKPKAIDKQVLVNGKANVVHSKHLMTPRGVVTEVSDQELKLLESCDAFKRHKSAGYITVDQKKVDGDKVAKNMKAKDESAPLDGKDVSDGKLKSNADKGK